MGKTLFQVSPLIPGAIVEGLTKVTAKGQIVIPIKTREKVGFLQGTRLVVVVVDGAVILSRFDEKVEAEESDNSSSPALDTGNGSSHANNKSR